MKHILCGATFDGSFFDYICEHGLVATSRIHNSGLDYLIIVYEKADALENFSRKLLCSYNRFSDGKRAFSSFGDADGSRIDYFRFYQQKRLGRVPKDLAELEKVWDSIDSDNIQEKILEELGLFIQTGSCDALCYQLMALFGYIYNGKIAVPVYTERDIPVMEAVKRLTIDCIYAEVKKALTAPKIASALFCKKQHVQKEELANELYHILFGQLNEALVSAGFVAEPKNFAGQGRYLQSIELM